MGGAKSAPRSPTNKRYTGLTGLASAAPLLLALPCLLSKDVFNCFAKCTDVSDDPEIHMW